MGKFKNPLIKQKLRESETRRIAREEYDRVCRKWTERFNLVSNTIALYTLHTAFGFGKDRADEVSLRLPEHTGANERAI